MRLKNILEFGILVCILVSFGGCANSYENKINLPSNKTKHTAELSIKEVGVVYFRRSYHGHEDMNDKELEKLEKSNPTIDSFSSDKKLIESFGLLGFTRQNELILKGKKFITPNSFELISDNKDTVKVQMSLHTGDESFLQITISRNGHTTLAKLKDHFLPPPQYALLDVVKGGYPEIVVLDQYYIMNGDNYDFHVYEIK